MRGHTWITAPTSGSFPKTNACPRYIQFAASSPAWSTRIALSRNADSEGVRGRSDAWFMDRFGGGIDDEGADEMQRR